ncbi:MAG: hypothetical protein ACFBWO_05935 [Paracoccaceae bacterium]
MSNPQLDELYATLVADLRELWQDAPDAGALADVERDEPVPHEAVLATLDTYKEALKDLPKDPTRAQILEPMKTATERLNALHQMQSGTLLGTGETQRIVPFMIDAATAVGLDPEKDPDLDATEGIREWGPEAVGPSDDNPYTRRDLPLYRRPAA